MVATRSSSKAPENAPPPTPSTTTTRRTASRNTTPQAQNNNSNNSNNSKKSAVTTSSSPSKKTTTSSAPSTAAATGWTHTPTTLTLAWLAISLPLVIWDTGYVLGRPATMPGGWAHAPIWSPYALYGEVDHMYGFKQWHAGNGFTAAQGSLNVVETVLYLVYFAIWYRAAPAATTSSSNKAVAGQAGQQRKSIAGRAAAWAVVFAFSAAVMTVSKTVLYWLNEGFSGFDNIGHNTPGDMVLLWIIPNGAWLVVPSYMIYQLGSEIIDAITIASQATGSIKTE